jgi:hypothetical protein
VLWGGCVDTLIPINNIYIYIYVCVCRYIPPRALPQLRAGQVNKDREIDIRDGGIDIRDREIDIRDREIDIRDRERDTRDPAAAGELGPRS